MSSRATLAKILIVDDDSEITDLLYRFLFNMGYRDIEIAVSGIEAIKKVSEKAPDLVILDLKLPDINGDVVFHIVQEIDRDVPVIVITGSPDSDIAFRMSVEGVADIISKPFDLRYLEVTVFSLMVQRYWDNLCKPGGVTNE